MISVSMSEGKHEHGEDRHEGNVSVHMMFGRFLVMKGKITERDLEETLQIPSELNRSLAEELLEGDHLALEAF